LLTATDRAVLDRAKDLHLERHVSFWDAMILGACLASGVRLLYSEDIPGGVISGVSLVNPFK
jgi:predicted nucleic acid-binding protein